MLSAARLSSFLIFRGLWKISLGKILDFHFGVGRPSDVDSIQLFPLDRRVDDIFLPRPGLLDCSIKRDVAGWAQNTRSSGSKKPNSARRALAEDQYRTSSDGQRVRQEIRFVK